MDSSCSGGTPFKRIIDQQNRDASNQQDRLVNNSGASGNQVCPLFSSLLNVGLYSFHFKRALCVAC